MEYEYTLTNDELLAAINAAHEKLGNSGEQYLSSVAHYQKLLICQQERAAQFVAVNDTTE